MNKEIPKQVGNNFCVLQTGPMEELHQYHYQHPKLRRATPGKLFLKEPLGLTSMEISLNKLPAGAAMPFFHKHGQNEEVYLFTAGHGEFMVDDQIIPIEPGTVIRVAPEGERIWRNNSTADLYYVVIQAKAGTLDHGTIEDGVGSNRPVNWSK